LLGVGKTFLVIVWIHAKEQKTKRRMYSLLPIIFWKNGNNCHFEILGKKKEKKRLKSTNP
jgi:hypothetical protein